MRIKWAALLTSISFLLAATSVSAQGPVALSSPQLDGIIPTYQLDPTQYQLRVAVDALTVADPDRVRDALLMEDPEESMAAQQMPGDEPEARCTPARRALLASAGRSESPAWQATPQQGSALTSAASNRQSPSTVIRLAATSRARPSAPLPRPRRRSGPSPAATNPPRSGTPARPHGARWWTAAGPLRPGAQPPPASERPRRRSGPSPAATNPPRSGTPARPHGARWWTAAGPLRPGAQPPPASERPRRRLRAVRPKSRCPLERCERPPPGHPKAAPCGLRPERTPRTSWPG